MPTIQQKIGQKIRTLREKIGWKQDDLAEESGLHPTYIGGIERGERNATIDSYYKIAKALSVPLEELFRVALHPLENLFKAPSHDIMQAILKGFRAQVDVKGKLAELYLSKNFFDILVKNNKIDSFTWNDKDSLPDFIVSYKKRDYRIECKNLRSGDEGLYKRPPSYKVEIQKTRNSKDGSNTRSYPVNYFDVLAVCMFNQTQVWDFLFIASEKLEKSNDPQFLKIMQRVPFTVQSPWEDNILTVLEEASYQTFSKPKDEKDNTAQQSFF